MTIEPNRRGLLCGLAALPLICGPADLLGKPAAAAALPVTDELLDAYSQWLHYERKMLIVERYAHLGGSQVLAMDRSVPMNTAADQFHFPKHGDYRAAMQPSLRAAIVLGAVGCPLAREA